MEGPTFELHFKLVIQWGGVNLIKLFDFLGEFYSQVSNGIVLEGVFKVLCNLVWDCYILILILRLREVDP